MEKIEMMGIDNVGNGNRTYFQSETKNVVFVDVGGDDKLKNTERILFPSTNVSIILTHQHEDHTKQLKTLIENHKEGKLKLNSVYADLSVLNSDILSKILESNEKIKLNDLGNSKERIIETLSYIKLSNYSYVTKEIINNYNKKHPEDKIDESEISKQTEDIKNKIKNDISEKLINEDKELEKYGIEKIFTPDEIEEISNKECSSLIKTLCLCYKNEIPVTPLKFNNEGVCKTEIEGMNFTLFRFDKDDFKKIISEAKKRNELYKTLGITDKFDDEYIKTRDELPSFNSDKEFDIFLEQKEFESELFTYIEKEFGLGKKELEEAKTDTGKLAYYLIKRAYSKEENIRNISCLAQDRNNSYYVGGDSEIPFEIQSLQRKHDISCDVCVESHHSSFTSNSILFLKRMIENSLDDNRTSVFISTASGDKEESCKGYNEFKHKYLETIRFSTSDGNIRIKNINEKLHFWQENISRNDMQVAYHYDILNRDKNLKQEEIEFNENVRRKFSDRAIFGIPFDELEDYLGIKAYAKLCINSKNRQRI